ncbi:unnamed protein product [Paramecium sonneborni]|uniref:Fungal lipase-type domain-containing protein n=1 Tax=Paramecium sonneborni TaxID=65129 RepID=A0A8S1R6X7_9CILI|nr:unnamed protein product [Paramecium sonneborni]
MLLSLYSEDETGYKAGKCNLAINQVVSFSETNYNRMMMKKTNGLDLNDYVKYWSVIQIIDDESSGYLGLILENQVDKQLVLSHRSTNFKLSFQNNIFKQSGVQCDVQGVVQQGLTNHQAQGYEATKLSLDIAKKKEYSLSFCGHSLGAWLAELSVYYCHAEFDVPCYNVKAVTFDGPGSWEMMKKLNSNHFKGQGRFFDQKQLEIINYLSAPNIVNCLNTHVGIGYRLYPKNIETVQYISKKFGDALASNKGHDLKYLLPFFDPIIGKPTEFALIKKWPKIKYSKKNEKQNNNNNTNTLKSLVILFSEYLTGKFDFQQFWDVHSYLNRSDGYKIKKKDDYFQEFCIQMKTGYQESTANLYSRKIIDKIDEYLQIIFDKKDYVEMSEINCQLKSLLNKIIHAYKCIRQTFSHEIIILIDYRSQLNIDLLRDQIRIILRDHKQQFLYFLDEKFQENNIKYQCFLGKLCDTSQQQIERLNIIQFEDLFMSSNIIAIVGPKRIGKTILAYQYALKLKKEGALIWPFSYQSEQTFIDNIHFYAQTIKLDIESYGSDKEIIDLLISQIESSKVRLVLVIDNIEKDFSFLEKTIKKFPQFIKIILISTNSLIFHTTQYQIIKVQPFSEKECLKYIDASLKQKNLTTTQKEQLIALSNKMPEHLFMLINYINSPQHIFKSVTQIFQTLLKINQNNGIYTPLITLFENEHLCQTALQYLAWLDPENIEINILRDLLNLYENDDQQIDESIEKLYCSSLITLKDENHISILKPIQDECRKFQFTIKQLTKMLHYFVKKLPNIQTNQYNQSSIQITEYYISHITNIVRIIINNQEFYIEQQNDQVFLETLSMLVFKLCIIHQYILINYKICKTYYDFLIQLQTLMNHENLFINNQQIRETFLLNKIDLYIQIGLYDEAIKEINDNLNPNDHKITAETQVYLKYEMACLYSYQKQYNISSNHFLNCLLLEQQSNLFIAKCHIGLAMNYYLQQNYFQAFQRCLIAQNIAKSLINNGESILNSQILQSQIFNLTGKIYQRLDNLDMAKDCFEKALSVLKRNSNNFQISYQIDILLNLGCCFQQMKQYKDAKNLFDQSMKLHINLYEDFKIKQLLDIQYFFGIMYLEKKKFGKAQNKFELILQIAHQIKGLLHISKINYQIGVIEKIKGNSFEYLKQLETIIKNLKEYYCYFHPLLLFFLQQLGEAYKEIFTDEGKRIELYQQSYFLKIIYIKQIEQNDQNKDGFTEIDINEEIDEFQNIQFMDDYDFSLLEKRNKDFYQTKITRDLIKASGIITYQEFKIKSKIQVTLNQIQQYAFLGKWKKDVLGIFSESIIDLISVKKIKTKLGPQFNSIQDLKIAFMLCFESINIGIVQSNFKYIGMLVYFSEKMKRKSNLQNLLEEILILHPEYFLDVKILKFLSKDQGIPFQTITIDSSTNQTIKDSLKKQKEKKQVEQVELNQLIQESSIFIE